MESRNIDKLLLVTKLTIPAIYPDKIIPRQRLYGQLDAGVQRPILLMSAPGGFGKTTLVAAWLRQKELSAAWVSLEKADNDPVRFWRYVIAALCRQHNTLRQQVEISQELSMWMGASPTPTVPAFNIEASLTSVLNALLELAKDLVLVLDDYQAITNSIIHQSMTFFLEHLPPRLHLLVITRSDPPLPMARLRVQDKLTEIRATDLCLTVDEAQSFLNQTMNLSLTYQQIENLCQRTEGWMAGIQLAALSLNGCDDASSVLHFIDKFTGTNRLEHKVPLIEMLSEREYAVLRLVGEGLSNQEIAHHLVVTVSTVKTHLNNIYAKFHVHTRLQAVTKAYDLGLLSPRGGETETEPLTHPNLSNRL